MTTDEIIEAALAAGEFNLASACFVWALAVDCFCKFLGVEK